MNTNTEDFKKRHKDYNEFSNMCEFMDFCWRNKYTSENSETCYDTENDCILVVGLPKQTRN